MTHRESLLGFVIYFLPTHQMLSSSQRSLASHRLCRTAAKSNCCRWFKMYDSGVIQHLWLVAAVVTPSLYTCSLSESNHSMRSKGMREAGFFGAAVKLHMHVSAAFWGTVGLKTSMEKMSPALPVGNLTRTFRKAQFVNVWCCVV